MIFIYILQSFCYFFGFFGTFLVLHKNSIKEPNTNWYKKSSQWFVLNQSGINWGATSCSELNMVHLQQIHHTFMLWWLDCGAAKTCWSLRCAQVEQRSWFYTAMSRMALGANIYKWVEFCRWNLSWASKFAVFRLRIHVKSVFGTHRWTKSFLYVISCLIFIFNNFFWILMFLIHN